MFIGQCVLMHTSGMHMIIAPQHTVLTCVFVRFLGRSTFACSVYEKLMTARRRRPYHSESVSSGGWSHTLPWLWYDSPPKQWLEAEDVQIRVQFSGGSIESGSVSLLPFILSAYALNGSWLGYQNLTDQFQICGAWKRHSTSWRRFGHNYINDCTLPLAEVGALIEAHGPPVFYELHLQDSPGSLYPVPIVLLGPGDEEGAVIEDEDTRLVRRFFFMDGDLGKARGGEDAAVVQFLEEFKLTVTLRGDGQIYAPRLTISLINNAAIHLLQGILQEWTQQDLVPEDRVAGRGSCQPGLWAGGACHQGLPVCFGPAEPRLGLHVPGVCCSEVG
ncbi:unnamed protein product [Ostreobium quekettii]|uniref:Uncharacterized protein n=1 Tax=Ostreobium quekettii TaxID=121088 RepID=A0A8S1JF54_9CHLO|nr:unnamed protein product [Ostreobium quekettii]